MSSAVLDALKSRFGEAVLAVHSQCGDDTALILPDHLVEVAGFLRDSPALAFDLPLDVTAVDCRAEPPPGFSAGCFEVIYHLRSISHRRHLRLKVRVDGEAHSLPSLSRVWRGVMWCEREVWEMFGIHFTNHPELQRLFLPAGFSGHPLRKDFRGQRCQPTVEIATIVDEWSEGLERAGDEEWT